MSTDNSAPWLDGLTISQVFDATGARFAEREAVVFPKSRLRWTYQQLAEQVDRAARGLLACGIRRGEHIGIWATNLPEWIVLQFATARIGAVLVTVNPAYRAHELKYVLRQSDAVALVFTDRYKSSDYFGMLSEICPDVNSPAADEAPPQICAAGYPKLRRLIAIKGKAPPGVMSWTQMLAAGADVPIERVRESAAEGTAADPINIQYTSGTTGFPKAAMLSHRNLLMNVFYGGHCQRLSEHDRICIPVPFYHCFGCVLGTLMAMVHGAAMVVPAESFDAAATLDAIEHEQCTSVYGVPTMFIAQLSEPSLPRRNLKSLRTGIMAGSPCPIETMRSVVNKMGCREITIGYGQTEASPIITQTRTDDPIELRVETVGRPLAGVEVKIAHPSTGEPLADNESGELCARGHCVMLGYYNNPEATREAIDAQGWLHTGDIAVRLPNGYYKITGRMKDLVIRGGENIYPREIEEFLFTHPAVEQASVIGVPDAKYVEELCAWIKLKPRTSLSEEELREFCRSRLAHFKVPKYVKFVSAFPQTVTGKIQKFKMREMMCDELGMKEQDTA